MKNFVILFLMLTFGAMQSAHSASLVADEDTDELKLCRQVAIQFALEKEMETWGDGVTIQSINRAVGTGSLIKPGGIDEFYNVEVTLNRESADPIVYEMALIARTANGKLTCELAKFITRDLL